ncbi:MAG: HD domain-containing protein [Candidatus Marinimicrobia bacterium]|nr:HD domain-containing protein [Candidatus Neomarinimicrobiota bacterium]
MTELETAKIISSLEHVYQLKSIPRSGWLQAGIPVAGVESIAGHSYGMSMLVLYLRSELQTRGVDIERVMHMAVIHDMAEAIVGDITPQDQIAVSEKFAAESAAFDEIIDSVREGEYFRELWDEFESGQTPEAQVVKRLDKLDMLIQAYYYEKKYEVNLDSFWKNMDDFFKDSESESIYDHIRLNRSQTKGNKE